MNTVIHTLNGQSLASQNTAAAGTGDNGRLRLPAAPSVGRHAGGDAEDIFRREVIVALTRSKAIAVPNRSNVLTPDRTAFGGKTLPPGSEQTLRKAETAHANFHISVGARVVPTLTRFRAKPIIQLHSGKFPRSRKLLPMVAQDARNFERIFGFWSGSSEPKCGFEDTGAPRRFRAIIKPDGARRILQHTTDATAMEVPIGLLERPTSERAADRPDLPECVPSESPLKADAWVSKPGKVDRNQPNISHRSESFVPS
jgi:hypothetical protein